MRIIVRVISTESAGFLVKIWVIAEIIIGLGALYPEYLKVQAIEALIQKLYNLSTH